MNETIVMSNDLDRLAERIEKAAQVVQQLRTDRDRLEQERDQAVARAQDLEQRLQGQDVAALMGELQTLRREQRDWTAERREVALRIETLVRKLEKLEI